MKNKVKAKIDAVKLCGSVLLQVVATDFLY